MMQEEVVCFALILKPALKQIAYKAVKCCSTGLRQRTGTLLHVYHEAQKCSGT
jgi:hypothetical protein